MMPRSRQRHDRPNSSYMVLVQLILLLLLGFWSTAHRVLADNDDTCAAVSASNVTKVPVIDMTNSDEIVARQLVDAFRTIGFATLIHVHPDLETLVSQAFAASASFFRLSTSQKMQYEYMGHAANRGYIPFQAENHDGHVTRPDRKETYDLGTQSEHWQTPWPTELMPAFQDDLLTYYHEFENIYQRVIQLVGLGLGLSNPHYLADRSGQHCNLRLLHYPAVDLRHIAYDDNIVVRGARHTDFGTLTLLTQDAVGGLRVQELDGVWTVVPPLPNSVVVNVGDMLQRWTNDVLQATPHQVVHIVADNNNVSKIIPERYSIAFFSNANKDVTLEVLSEVSDEPAKYAPVNAFEYLTQRLTDTITSTAG